MRIWRPNLSVRFRPRREVEASRPRFFLGLSVRPGAGRVDGALIEADGHGLDCRPVIRASDSRTVAAEACDAWQAIRDMSNPPIDRLAALRRRLVDAAARLAHHLMPDAGPHRDRVLAVGWHDPGLWYQPAEEGRFRAGLCEPGYLAEKTGISVIDDFPARDLARGGTGGPIDALGKWLLLGRPLRQHAPATRLLVELADTTRLLWLPAEGDERGMPHLSACDAGPGTALLDHLTVQMTEGRERFDAGGRLAVQGQRIDELLERWLADPALVEPGYWQPRGIAADSLAEAALGLAAKRNWAVQDVLCTATELVAACIQRAVKRRSPQSPRVDRMVLTGGGRHNGFLLRQVKLRLPHLRIRPIDELGFDDVSLTAGAAAALAMLHVDQVPANVRSVTGAEVARVLGRLTPGKPAAWHRLLGEMADNRPHLMPLRDAA